MEKEEIKRVLVEVLTEVQKNSGHPTVEIDDDTGPIGDLPGFDSLTGIEATVELGRRLGREINLENIFVNEKGNRALRVSEIAAQLFNILRSEVASDGR